MLPHAPLLPAVTRPALEEVALYADGLTTKVAMKRVRKRIAAARNTTPSERTTIDDFVCYAIERASSDKRYPQTIEYSEGVLRQWVRDYEPRNRVALARCVFGNPFRSTVVEPTWLSSAVVGVAAGIYEERAFQQLPILADALEEAGCADEDILRHCRNPGPHVRGCWVVDLVLTRL
jgi:hypothetical protein